jgi:hypothetical protein
MKNKLVIILGLMVVIIVLSTIIFVSEKSEPEINMCDDYLTMNDIFHSGDVEKCSCLDDDSEQAQCKNNILNANSYTEAIKNSDISLCDEIESEHMRYSCITITQGKIDFANSNENNDDNEDDGDQNLIDDNN